MLSRLIQDRYRLDKEIGQGGMGVVYQARDMFLDRSIAVKVLMSASSEDERRERLLQEARAVAGLNHPNIVTVHDAGEFQLSQDSSTMPFIVMELIDGKALHEHQISNWEEIISITQQICAALEHAHSNGIIHRDLKPENVLITPGGVVKIMDFGLARSGVSRLTDQGDIAGTVYYLAPELASGEEYDGRADLYALGVMLYELTTGELPFMAEDPVEVIALHLREPVMPPREKNLDVPPFLNDLIVNLLSKRPDDRPASASEVLEALAQWSRGETTASGLEISTFGGLELRKDGKPVTSLVSRKAEALLVYLASNKQTFSREVLANLLWGDKNQKRSMGNLRVILHSLRKELGDFVEITNETVAINFCADVLMDVAEIDGKLTAHLPNGEIASIQAAEELKETLSLYRGDFLEGFYVRGASDYEEWLLIERERIRQLVQEALLALVLYHQDQGDYKAGIAHARQLLQIDPLSEQANQYLMRLLAYSGQRNAALTQYEIYSETLMTELGVDPTEETTNLYQQIKHSDLEIPSPAGEITIPTAIKHNLPEQPTTFVGREQELADIVQLLVDPEYHLVTLTGPGGVGKTRLALQAARNLLNRDLDGIFFVDLAPILEPELVPSRIAQVFKIKETPGRALLEDIKEHLRTKRLLLVLDNFEQLIAAAPIVNEMLSSTPHMNILTTSREALRVYGEQEYPVPPLALPEPKSDKSSEYLARYESVALFVQRARATSPNFQLSEENARVIAEICIRLDGLPLAIELAAARIKLFKPSYLLHLLNDSLGTLTGGPRDLAYRHQTLRAAIEWSYNMLSEPEKKLFARMAIFQGGRTLEAIEAVCNHDLNLDVLTGIESLYNKSLLKQMEGIESAPRFIYLETIHQYARESLEKLGETETLHRRHALYFLELAERAEPELRGPKQEYWSNYLRLEYDNLWAALGWSLKDGDSLIGIRLVAALSEFWYYEGPISDGEMWVEQAISLVDDVPPATRAKMLNGAGMLAFASGDHEQGKIWNRQALATAREIQDKYDWAWALFWLSAHATVNSDEYQQGIALCEQALSLFREIDDKHGLAWGYNQLGELSRLVEDYAQAREAYEQSIIICRLAGNRRREAIALINLSYVAQHQQDYEQAERYALDGLALLQELKLKYHSAISLAMLAGPVAMQGKARRAATLLGASEAIFENMSVSLQPADQIEIGRYITRVREQLNQEEYEAARAEGRSMTYDQAIAFAFEESSHRE